LAFIRQVNILIGMYLYFRIPLHLYYTLCLQMQSEHNVALTKNYVLLVNETPVDDILDELRQQQILNEEQREFIARQSTHKGRTTALLERLPGRGPDRRRFTLSVMRCWPVTRTSWYRC